MPDNEHDNVEIPGFRRGFTKKVKVEDLLDAAAIQCGSWLYAPAAVQIDELERLWRLSFHV